VFREFFERLVQLCVEAGLVWGEESYFDATKVDANASLDSIAPRFYVQEHLDEVFTTVAEPPHAEQEHNVSTASERGESPMAELYELPFVGDNVLTEENAARDDWISRNGHQRREQKGVWYRRKADFLASNTDPDSSPMKRRDSKGSHLGYYTHYVVDGGKVSVGDTLNAISEAGLTLEASMTNDMLKVFPAENVTPELVAAIKEHKGEIIKIMREDEEIRRTGKIRFEWQVFELAREFFGLDDKGSAR
jgi:hypothetical protein